MHCQIILSILLICAILQINAKPIDDERLPNMLDTIAKFKRNLAIFLKSKAKEGTVTQEDFEFIRSTYALSAVLEDHMANKLRKPFDNTSQLTGLAEPISTAKPSSSTTTVEPSPSSAAADNASE